MEERIRLAFKLEELEITSVPINILNPIKGTPLEKLAPLSTLEIYQTIAIFRFILPKAVLRLASGRNLLSEKGRLAFLAGANGAISGDMLTTTGTSIKEDIEMITKLGFKIKAL